MKSIVKIVIKKILPNKLYLTLQKNKRNLWNYLNIKKAYKYDMNRYRKYSDLSGINNATKLISKIIREYHVIEKGLTMPESRLGFGHDLIISLCKSCVDYYTKYEKEEEQLKHAIGVIFEYKLYHEKNNFDLDAEVVSEINEIVDLSSNIKATKQIETTKEEYFKFANSDFVKFSNSRSSVRNYCEEDIPIEKIIEALELCRNTPSVCNRQGWRTYIYKNKEQIKNILEIQGGNRGFGHLTNKLIVITEELGIYSGIYERNQAFIDGGMYAMNLLYALHCYKIGACILNCSNTPEKDKILRRLCNIKETEVFITMISCGIPPAEIKVAISKRYDVMFTNKKP